MATKRGGKAYYMISAVAQKYSIHPQTLRLYEREGLLKPSRTEGNTRLYSEEDLEQLETILSLTRDLGVNLAGVEIILNMRRKMEQMQGEVNQFMEYVKHGAREVFAVRARANVAADRRRRACPERKGRRCQCQMTNAECRTCGMTKNARITGVRHSTFSAFGI
jgi:MerR family transcriptional regulator/heat shock protein HspR